MRNILYIFLTVSLCFGSFSVYAEDSSKKSCTKKVVKDTAVMAGAGAVLGCLGAIGLSFVPVVNFAAAPTAVTLCSAGLGAAAGATVGAAKSLTSDECD